MRIVKENIIKTHRYSIDGSDNDTLIETIEQYHYESKEEKEKHKMEMQSKGFEDSGQVRDNIGTIMNPIYVWFGSYYKYEID